MLFHGDAFGQVPGLVDVAAPLQGDVVRQQLQGRHTQLGQQHRLHLRHRQHSVCPGQHSLPVGLGGQGQDAGAPGLYLHHVAHSLVKQRPVGAQGDNRRSLLDQGDGAVLQLAGGIRLGVDIADLLELQASLQAQGIVQVPADEEYVVPSGEILGHLPDPVRLGQHLLQLSGRSRISRIMAV